MQGRIELMTDIDEIKSRLSIEEVIAEYIQIKKAGSGFTGLCPFHNEKSPSFNVSPSRGIYKCFGCGESGDIFTFVEKMDGVEFPEALEKLARKAGVVVTKQNKGDKEKQDMTVATLTSIRTLEDQTR